MVWRVGVNDTSYVNHVTGCIVTEERVCCFNGDSLLEQLRGTCVLF